MPTRRLRAVLLIGSAFLTPMAIGQMPNRSTAGFEIPKVWDDSAVEGLELPLVEARMSAKHVPAEYYYRMRVRPIYRSYPVYAPGREPNGYFDSLRTLDPEVVFDPAKLKTTQDWVKAGELVFDAPVSYDRIYSVEDIRDPSWYMRTGVKALSDGAIPYIRYVIRSKGKVEVGNNSCGSCHTRILVGGIVVKGAQGDFPFSKIMASGMRSSPPAGARRVLVGSYAAPWLTSDIVGGLSNFSLDTAISALEAIPPGVQPRQGTSFVHPAQVPDLIGIQDRRYLDHTGLQLQRDIGDLMRYAAINQGLDNLARFGDFIPADASGLGKLPDPGSRERYSDEQLYALGLYLYSLQPPANPNGGDPLAARGEKVFRTEGCGQCHTPPLYTSNKLTPVRGFRIPEEHKSRYAIIPVVVDTDPGLALSTRRGTGYYKIPSLRGVWYRSPLEHSGSVTTLEEWFDPKRLRDDYVPTGFRGYQAIRRAVKGHEFGLKLPSDDKRALIAFLKTL